MTQIAHIETREQRFVFCAIVACAFAALAFALNAHIGFNLQDESFLWYGVQRTHAGELPMRDFRAYDPGRYFWCSMWAYLFGDGLVAVRAASWIFAAGGLTCGMLAARRAIPSRYGLVLVGFLLTMWLWPPWKLFEASIAMTAVFLAVRLVESPTKRRHVVAGLCVGLAAFLGRNLGLYTGLAFGAITLLVAWKERSGESLRRVGWLARGVLGGYAPMILLVLLSSGFRAAFVDSVRFYVGQNALNAQLAAPFPWRVDFTGRDFAATASLFAIGFFFVAFFVVYALALLPIVRTKREDLGRNALLVASVFVGICLAHHASVRSDLSHLAQTVHPLLFATLALAGALPSRESAIARGIALLVLTILSVYAIGLTSPIVRRLSAPPLNEFVTAKVGVDTVVMPRNEMRALESLRTLITLNVKPEEKLWVGAPFIGLYPLFGRRSPAWEIYPAWKADDAGQERLLGELTGVEWVLVDTRPIGGDEEMQISRSHARVWQMLMSAYDRIQVPGAPETLYFLRRKRA